jgi:uncharacterized membrane protein YqiK
VDIFLKPEFLILVGFPVGVLIFVLSLLNPFHLIDENEVGLVEKKIIGATLAPGQVVAARGEQGMQARTLAPGLHILPRPFFKVTRVPITTVPQGKIASVTSIDGQSLRSGQLLASSVPGHSSFQDGAAFLANNGQKGPQVEILAPGQYRINTRLFQVQISNAVIVRTGQIGIVESFDGAELRDEQILGDSVKGHNDFQNGQTFLQNNGQRGPQLDILKPGMYYINPMLFDVNVQNATVINIGEVGVIRSNVGILPPVGEDGRTPDLVDEGYRGVLKTVIEPNTYYLNPIAYVVFPISTLNMTIDWNTLNTKTPLDSITVKSRDGFSFPVDVKVVIRVLKEMAPVVVSKIGSIQNAIDRVIHPAIGATFRNNAENCDALDFLNNRSRQQANAKEVTTLMLRDYGIETVDVLIGNVGIPEELLKTQTDRFLAKEREKTYREQQVAEDTRRELEKATAIAGQQKVIVAAQAAIEVAEANRQAAIANAEGEARRIQLLAEGESQRIRLIAESDAHRVQVLAEANQVAFQTLSSQIGQEGVILLEALKLVKDGQIKITPEVSVGGQNGLLSALTALMVNTQRKANPALTNGSNDQN